MISGRSTRSGLRHPMSLAWSRKRIASLVSDRREAVSLSVVCRFGLDLLHTIGCERADSLRGRSIVSSTRARSCSGEQSREFGNFAESS